MTDDPQEKPDITIELACHLERGRATTVIDGWIESVESEILRLRQRHTIELSSLDARIQGSVYMPLYIPGATRCTLNASTSVTVDGRAIGVGDRVRITTGGEITWNP